MLAGVGDFLTLLGRKSVAGGKKLVSLQVTLVGVAGRRPFGQPKIVHDLG